jgi:hypothetical protein
VNRRVRRGKAVNLPLLAAVLTLAAGLAQPMGVRAQESDGLVVANAYVAAMNYHDTDEALALFATDATVADDGRRAHGAEELRRWLQEQANRDVRIQFRAGPSASADTVTWVGLVTFDDGGPVRTEFWSSTTLGIQAGMITSVTTRDAVQEAWRAYRPQVPAPAQVPHQQAPQAQGRETVAVIVPNNLTDLTAPLLVGGLGAAAYLVLLARRYAGRR